MIDLIEKIHELKDYENYDYDQAITDVEILLDQYNIITAPKTIKLSEIVKKLKKSLTNPKNKVNVYKENENEIVIKISYFAIGTFVDETTIDLSDKIYDIDGFNNLMSSRFKWLYALWIAGTIIEDDLKERD